MRRRSVTVALLPLLSALTGCVVYRDRVVTVQTTQVEAAGPVFTGDVQRASVSLGAVVELPTSPRSLTAAEIVRALDGYGRWVDDPRYGRVWVPATAESDAFTPYVSRGAWQLTRAGWYWQSDDAWGAVTFHYGRWADLGGVWGWVPGTAFAPAWVDWRTGAGWVGWSPLAPLGATAVAPYVYCAASTLGGRGLGARVVSGDAATSLYARTTSVDPVDSGLRQGYAARVAGGDEAGVGVDDAWTQSLRARSSLPADSSGPAASRGRSAFSATVMLDGLRDVPAAHADAVPGVRLAQARTLDGGPPSPFAGRQSVSLGVTYDLAPRAPVAVAPAARAPAAGPSFGGLAPSPVSFPAARTLSPSFGVDAPAAWGGAGRASPRSTWAPSPSPVAVLPAVAPSFASPSFTAPSSRIDAAPRVADGARVSAAQVSAPAASPWGSSLSQPLPSRAGAIAAGGGRASSLSSPAAVMAPGLLR